VLALRKCPEACFDVVAAAFIVERFALGSSYARRLTAHLESKEHKKP
jgi:hypothetical protein